MNDVPSRRAVFAGLIFNEQGEPAEVTTVGGEPCYVILDGDFRRHVEAKKIDRQVLELLMEQVLSNRELVTEGMLELLGQEDLFTKAAIDASIGDLDGQMQQLMSHGLPEELRAWLGMLGFRVVVDVHGEVVELEAPGAPDTGEW